MKKHPRHNQVRVSGFTLVEVIVAVGLFTIISTISVAALLSAIDANRKARQVQAVTDNLSLMLEDMARSIRTGENIDCGALGGPKNCPAPAGASAINFDSDDHGAVRYDLSGGRIRKEWTQPTSHGPVPVSDPRFAATGLAFFVYNTPGTSDGPYVVIHIKGSIQAGAVQTGVDLQTTVAKR